MLKMGRLWLWGAGDRVRRWLQDEIVRAPLEPILHPSSARLRWLGAFSFAGHLFFAWFWGHLVPQPFESVPLRLAIACLGLPLLLDVVNRDPAAPAATMMFSLIAWLELPVFFSSMYWMNGGNPVWFASMACMLVIYYHLTDWRLASLGTVVGLGVSYLAVRSLNAQATPFVYGTEQALVLLFAWLAAIFLGLSSANLRRSRLQHTLSTMAVMAHELRTPLATINLLGDVLRGQGQQGRNPDFRGDIDALAGKLQGLVHSMNRQIDTQISNAQLFRLHGERTVVQAATLVQDVVYNYPFRSDRERDCVGLDVQQDFCFLGSQPLFAQVLTNLIKNALHSLAATSRLPAPGDLCLTIHVQGRAGRIDVADRGVGIALDNQQRIFEPFFSTQSGVGSGLGLSFSKNVVTTYRGHLGVTSKPGQGAVFRIELPLHFAHPR